jgi:hypothetical protein
MISFSLDVGGFLTKFVGTVNVVFDGLARSVIKRTVVLHEMLWNTLEFLSNMESVIYG